MNNALENYIFILKEYHMINDFQFVQEYIEVRTYFRCRDHVAYRT